MYQPKVAYNPAFYSTVSNTPPVLGSGGSEAGLQLLAPSLAALLVCANRLLKPKNPSFKNRSAFAELLKKHCFQTTSSNSAKPLALHGEQLAPLLLQQLAQQLWFSGLRVSSGRPSSWSWLLHGLVFLRDSLHSQSEAWLLEDLNCLLASQQQGSQQKEAGLSAERFLPLSKPSNLLRLAEALYSLPKVLASSPKVLYSSPNALSPTPQAFPPNGPSEIKTLVGDTPCQCAQVLLQGWMQTPLPWEALLLQAEQHQQGLLLQDSPYLREWQALYKHLQEAWPQAHAFETAFLQAVAQQDKNKKDEHKKEAKQPETLENLSLNWVFEAFAFLMNSPSLWPLSQPISALMLVEGASEELLLPTYAKALGLPLPLQGLCLKSVGGKNHMLASYLQVRAWANFPLLLLLDNDALPLLPALQAQLRQGDEGDDGLFCLDYGELEDGYAWPHILALLKTHYGSACKVESLPTGLETKQDKEKQQDKGLEKKLDDWLSLHSAQTAQAGHYKQASGKQEPKVEQLRQLWLHLGLSPLDKTTLARLLSELKVEPEWVALQLQGILGHAYTLAHRHRLQALQSLQAFQQQVFFQQQEQTPL